jgi:hypothetical protein
MMGELTELDDRQFELHVAASRQRNRGVMRGEDAMQPAAIISELEGLSEVKLFEMAHVTTFKGYRTLKNGGSEAVTIEMHDRGPSAQRGQRYSCVATNERGSMATGNPTDSIELVLSEVHWFDLDAKW